MSVAVSLSLDELLDIATAWSGLGWAVQEQIIAVIQDGEPLQDQNPNALAMGLEFLESAAELEIDDADVWVAEIREYLKNGAKS